MTFSRSADPLPVAGLVLLAAVGGTVLIRRSSPRPAVVLACVTLLLAVPQEVPFGIDLTPLARSSPRRGRGVEP